MPEVIIQGQKRARYFDVPKHEALRRAENLLKFTQLDEKRNVKIDQLSTGMKRRLILARALVRASS